MLQLHVKDVSFQTSVNPPCHLLSLSPRVIHFILFFVTFVHTDSKYFNIVVLCLITSPHNMQSLQWPYFISLTYLLQFWIFVVICVRECRKELLHIFMRHYINIHTIMSIDKRLHNGNFGIYAFD